MPSYRVPALRLAAGLGFLVCIAPALAQNSDPDRVPSAADAKERQACTPDVMRLCKDAIPDIPEIVACLKRQRSNLSPACGEVFGVAERHPPAPPAKTTAKTKGHKAAAADRKAATADRAAATPDKAAAANKKAGTAEKKTRTAEKKAATTDRKAATADRKAAAANKKAATANKTAVKTDKKAATADKKAAKKSAATKTPAKSGAPLSLTSDAARQK